MINDIIIMIIVINIIIVIYIIIVINITIVINNININIIMIIMLISQVNVISQEECQKQWSFGKGRVEVPKVARYTL